MSRRHHNKTGSCQVCGKTLPMTQLVPANLVQGGVLRLIRNQRPEWDENGLICYDCLNEYRTRYIQQLMEKDLGELDELETEVVQSLRDNALVSENLNEEYEQSLSFGERVADKVAEFGGSWAFILWFGFLIVVWVVANTLLLRQEPFDPYPFILLNLFLSLLAAVQAPIIMMSQNRQADRDRMRAENDYQVNLKSEVEIRIIAEKLDQLLHQEMRRFMEIQQIQTEMLKELQNKIK